jgi:hypothetical protein
MKLLLKNLLCIALVIVTFTFSINSKTPKEKLNTFQENINHIPQTSAFDHNSFSTMIYKYLNSTVPKKFYNKALNEMIFSMVSMGINDILLVLIFICYLLDPELIAYNYNYRK